MTEPTNPLFEDEKDFLMRKKLEYERALRGDVQEIKEQTVQVGKVALIGAGAVSGVWLLIKAFGGRKPKKKHKKHRRAFEDYAGFDSFDENDQELTDLATDFQATDYTYDQDGNYVPVGGDDGFYYGGSVNDESDSDDNGLDQDSAFSTYASDEHSFGDSTAADTQHMGEDHGYDEGPDGPYSSPTSFEALPYDDSRRLPHSQEFDEPASSETHAESFAPSKSGKKASSALGFVGPALLAFAKSETGRVVVAQAAAVALAMVTKAVQDILPKNADETSKNADLADSSATKGAQPVAWPATSAVQNATAAAHHDDTLTPREPLA